MVRGGAGRLVDNVAATTVSIINLKGGVGKSTLTMLLGEYLAFRHSKSVLLIDMDAQANLSYCDQEFSDLHHKYGLSYRLSNPTDGLLSRQAAEDRQYRLEDRLTSLVGEFMERCSE